MLVDNNYNNNNNSNTNNNNNSNNTTNNNNNNNNNNNYNNRSRQSTKVILKLTVEKVNRRIYQFQSLHFSSEQLCINGYHGSSTPHQQEDMDEVDGVIRGIFL